MTQTNKDIPTFQLPGEPSGTGSNEAATTDAPVHERDAATYSESPWPQETATASTTAEYPADMDFIEAALRRSDDLERLRQDALGA